MTSTGPVIMQTLFRRLRDEGFALGPAQFGDLYSAVASGHGITGCASMYRCARALWASSPTEWRTFDRLFRIWVGDPGAEFEEDDVDERLAPSDAGDRGAEDALEPERSDETQELDLTPQPDVFAPTTSSSRAPDQGPTTVPLPRFEAADPELFGEIIRLEGADPDQVRRRAHAVPAWPLRPREVTTLLRRSGRVPGARQQIDVRETIRRVARDGYFLTPAWSRPTRQLRLVVLIDSGGSMIPFAPLIEELLAGFDAVGSVIDCEFLYCTNLPETIVYRDVARRSPLRWDEVLRRASATRRSILFVSDAGSARGHHTPRRVEDSLRFVRDTARRKIALAWLNPCPEPRWQHTTASEIIESGVSMWPLDEAGLARALASVAGHAFPISSRASSPSASSSASPATWATEPSRRIRRTRRWFQRHSEAHRLFALHASVPLTLTPDLSFAIWACFGSPGDVSLPSMPWHVVTDLLFSPFCRNVGGDRFQLDPDLRSYLLEEARVDEHVGESRITAVARLQREFAQSALASSVGSTSRRAMARAEVWAADSFVRPAEVRRELTQQLQYPRRTTPDRLAWITGVVEATQGSDSGGRELLEYSREIRSWMSGTADARSSSASFFGSDESRELHGVTVRNPFRDSKSDEDTPRANQAQARILVVDPSGALDREFALRGVEPMDTYYDGAGFYRVGTSGCVAEVGVFAEDRINMSEYSESRWEEVDAILTLGLVHGYEHEGQVAVVSVVETPADPEGEEQRAIGDWRLAAVARSLPRGADLVTFPFAGRHDASDWTVPLDAGPDVTRARDGGFPPLLQVRAVARREPVEMAQSSVEQEQLPDDAPPALAEAARLVADLVEALPKRLAEWLKDPREDREMTAPVVYLPRKPIEDKTPEHLLEDAYKRISETTGRALMLHGPDSEKLARAALQIAHEHSVEAKHRIWISWNDFHTRCFDLHNILRERRWGWSPHYGTLTDHLLSWIAPEEGEPALLVLDGVEERHLLHERGMGSALSHFIDLANSNKVILLGPKPISDPRVDPVNVAEDFNASKWILVAGSSKGQTPEVIRDACHAAARAIAEQGFGLITGTHPGVDETVADAFVAEVESRYASVEGRLLRIVTMEPSGTIPGRLHRHDGDFEEEAIKRADGIVLIGGQGYTKSLAQRALSASRALRAEQSLPILPLAWTGGDSDGVFRELSSLGTPQGWGMTNEVFQTLANPRDGESIEDTARSIRRLLCLGLAPRAPRFDSVSPSATQRAELLETLQIHDEPIRVAAWLPAQGPFGSESNVQRSSFMEGLLATAGDDDVIRIWIGARNEIGASLAGHAAPVVGLHWVRPDTLVTWDETGVLLVHQGGMESGFAEQHRIELPWKRERVSRIAMWRDGLIAVATFDGTVEVLEAEAAIFGGAVPTVVRSFTDIPICTALEFTEDGGLVVAAERDFRIVAPHSSEFHTLAVPQSIASMSLRRDSKRGGDVIALGMRTGSVSIFSSDGKEALDLPRIDAGPASRIRFSPSTDQVAYSSEEGGTAMFEVSSGRELGSIQGTLLDWFDPGGELPSRIVTVNPTLPILEIWQMPEE